MIITIGWNAGSGKSTIIKLLSERLWYERISIGDMRRAVGQKMGLSIYEFNLLAAQPWNEEKFDKEFDMYQQQLDINQNIIVDSRLGYFNIPKSIKLYLIIDPIIAAQRIFNNLRDQDRWTDLQATLDVINLRNSQDKERYISLYQTDPRDTSNYDLVVNTTDKAVEEVYQIIIDFINKYKQLQYNNS